MPGSNCSIVGCGTSRYRKGVGIFQLPADTPKHRQWREDFLAVIKRTREEDDHFANMIKTGHVYACEKHFKPEEIIIHEGQKMTKRLLKENAIPTLNLPLKSHDNPKPERAPPTKRESLPKLKRDCYRTLLDVINNAKMLKSLSNWTIEDSGDGVELKLFDNKLTLPKYYIHVAETLDYTIYIYGWRLPPQHGYYENYGKSLKNVTISQVVSNLQKYELCKGLDYHDRLTIHSIPFKINHHNHNHPFQSKIYHQCRDCLLLTSDTICQKCFAQNKSNISHNKLSEARKQQPVKLNAPLSMVSPERLQATVKCMRVDTKQLKLENNQLQKKLLLMECELKKNSMLIGDSLCDDLVSIMGTANLEKTPFMSLFWQQQKSLFTRAKSGARFHPMIIRFCLSIATKSASAYEEMRNSGILVLPSLRTLRDYKNYITPSTGFCNSINDELKMQTSNYTDNQRYVSLLIDEMKVKSNLVFQKTTNELIGFVDLGDPDVNYATLDETVIDDELASHALVFMLRGITTNLKSSLAYFATKGISGIQLFTLFWDAVYVIEICCNLKLIAVTADGASPNRKLFNMHKEANASNDAGNDVVVYRTNNLYAKGRYIYFFNDAPHLMKTTRNCFYSSGDERFTRQMWNSGNYILWKHIRDIYNQECGLKLLPKITKEHIKLTPYSKMRVSLATQVLSETVANVLNKFGPPQAKETAIFCRNMDQFFDCLNVRSMNEGKFKLKSFLLPYKSVDDVRFDWIMNDFLPYFEKWLNSIDERQGDFTDAEKAKMFISWQSYEGIQRTCYSVIDATKFLLSSNIPFVLTERFCQDSLEEYFGCQRKLCRRNENPDMNGFGYSSNTLRVQRNTSCHSGNTQGRKDNKRTWVGVSDEPLPKKNPKSHIKKF